MRKGLVAANWKMNGLRQRNATLIHVLKAGLESSPNVEVLVCPPAVYLEQVGAELDGSLVMLGAQNLHPQQSGAFTGELSAEMLKDIGCRHVIIGHSERRQLFGEENSFIAEKFTAAQRSGLIPILCIGETQEQHEAGETEAVVLEQLEAVLAHAGIEAFNNAVIAYEPVWASGTGLTATPEQAQEVHALIRGKLAGANTAVAESTRILYGGSVKDSNAAELFAKPDIDGGLVGGASLDAEDFLRICNSYSG